MPSFLSTWSLAAGGMAVLLFAAACAPITTPGGQAVAPTIAVDSALFEATLQVVLDSAAAVSTGFSGAGSSTVARLSVDPARHPTLEMESPAEWWRLAPLASANERAMRVRVLERRHVPAASVDGFAECPGALAPVSDGNCPPPGTVLALIGQSIPAGDSARVAVAWLTTDGKAQTALAATLRFRRCNGAWCFVRKAIGIVIE